jgi:uncharacterized ParB-like nuclease family protein
LELLLSKPSKHSVLSFGEDYGSYCAAWEDGACSESLDLKKCTNGPGHTCGSKKGCHELWDGYNFNQDQLWCCDSWCYVNATTCTANADLGIDVLESWLDIPGLYYSYGACEDDQTFPKATKEDLYNEDNDAVTLSSYASYTAETCPYRAQPTGCECIGSNDALGRDQKAMHGEDYGKWCAAWEDGLFANTSLTAAQVKALADGSHTGGGNLSAAGAVGALCHEHWPKYKWHEPQPWCCDDWCYVDATTCNGTKYGIDVKPSWTGRNLYYSYGACADWKTKPTKPVAEAPGRAANFAKRSCATCPWAKSVVLAWNGSQTMQTQSELSCMQDYGMSAKTTAPGRQCETFKVPDSASGLAARSGFAASVAAVALVAAMS